MRFQNRLQLRFHQQHHNHQHHQQEPQKIIFVIRIVLTNLDIILSDLAKSHVLNFQCRILKFIELPNTFVSSVFCSYTFVRLQWLMNLKFRHLGTCRRFDCSCSVLSDVAEHLAGCSFVVGLVSYLNSFIQNT